MNTNETIKELYTKELYSMKRIANKLGISAYQVKKILLEEKVSLRTRAEQNNLTNQAKGKKVNHNYFDNIDSNRKAWMLGFLAADGNIGQNRNSIKLSLSAIDTEILEKIKQEINIERDVKTSITNKGFEISALAWSSANQKIQLSKYGIVPNKTYKGTKLPRFVEDEEKQMSFLLGYFDGDGCFKNDGKYCRIEICSYSSSILQDFSDLIERKFSFKKDVYKDKQRVNYYTLTYSTQEAETILDYLYKANDLFLKRKKDKYFNWKIQNNRI